MLLIGFLLLPVVLVTGIELTISNYVINIENNTLTNVKATDRSSLELNLEGLALRRIDNGTFNDQINLKILNLANNSLNDLPEFVFSNLTNLEQLSLADNNITNFPNAFVGLDNLKILNISNNPVVLLGPGEFYGLSTSVNVVTLGGKLKKMSAHVFEKRTESMRKHRRATRSLRWRPGDFPKSTYRVKACVENGKLKLVDFLQDNETLTSDCTEIEADIHGRLFIEYLNITSFERGWYRMKGQYIFMVSLASNEITEISPYMLNDLPASVRDVELDFNKIERIKRGIIYNRNINDLRFAGNLIREIEYGAFRNTYLRELNLNDNQLTDIKFVDSLPESIEGITITWNQITEIPNGSFLKLPHINDLDFEGNNITELRMDALRGISFMYSLGLSSNRITRIEPGVFRNIRTLRSVYLRNNSIAMLENGVFDNHDGIDFVDLGMNKLTNVTNQIRGKLPKKLRKLLLDFNDIHTLESGDFVKVPYAELSLRGNKLTRIAKGSMMLPNLISLDLGNNSLNSVDGELFENFRNIDEVRLDRNGITKIEKGFAKHLFNITVLDISWNPMKKLENGALYGIRKDDADRFILMSQTPIEIIQGGLFEDMQPLTTEFPLIGPGHGESK